MPPPHLMHPCYRKDIDGLRAIAVLAVVGFHAFPDCVEGGFVGVDIFFVISGYLISSIIFINLQKNRFSFIEFYFRRIRRIFPSLFLVLISSLLLGWFALLPDEYMQLGKHIAAGASFVSNFILWNESGYFGNTAENKPLLHLWSLGIEEQFYILFPLLIWASWKIRVNFLTVSVLAATISFIFNIAYVEIDTSSTFYLPQTRFWELLLGSILSSASLQIKNYLPSNIILQLSCWLSSNKFIYKISSNAVQNSKSVLGNLLILIAFFVTTKEKNFPGWWAVLPTLGAVLVISAGENAWLNRTILSNRGLVLVGLISFPLYLWHWPLLTAARIIEGDMPALVIRLAAVFLSFILAWLTYHLIEVPIRFGKCFTEITVALIVLMGCLGGVGYYVKINHGIPLRAYPQSAARYLITTPMTNRQSECFEIPYAYTIASNWYCHLGWPTKEPSMFAYGDSHALSLLPAIERYASETNTKILFTGTSGCPPLLGIQAQRGGENIKKYNCEKLNNRIFEHVKSTKIKSVILAARWTYYTGGTTRPKELSVISLHASRPATKENSIDSFIVSLRYTIEKYNSIGVHVFLIDDIPQQIFDPASALKKSRTVSDDAINKHAIPRSAHISNQAFVFNEINKYKSKAVSIINLDNILCREDICPLVYDGKFLYFDDDHLSVAGAELIYPTIAQALLMKN